MTQNVSSSPRLLMIRYVGTSPPCTYIVIARIRVTTCLPTNSLRESGNAAMTFMISAMTVPTTMYAREFL